MEGEGKLVCGNKEEYEGAFNASYSFETALPFREPTAWNYSYSKNMFMHSVVGKKGHSSIEGGLRSYVGERRHRSMLLYTGGGMRCSLSEA